MARHVLIVAAVVVLSGCTAAGPMVSVLRGNLAYSRGDYQTALVHYLSARESAEERGWLLFNSGNVYYALGEQEAALSSWDEARSAALSGTETSGDQAVPTVLIHATSYNRGVLLYQRGEYRRAYDEFRYALSVSPHIIAAKTNLELSLQKLRAAEQARRIGGGAPEAPGDAEEGQASLRILEYVRRKEAQRWFANRESDDTTDPRDW